MNLGIYCQFSGLIRVCRSDSSKIDKRMSSHFGDFGPGEWMYGLTLSESLH